MVPKKQDDVTKIVPSCKQVYYFKEKSHLKHNSEAPPHYHIVLPVNKNTYVIFACIQSKVSTLVEHHKWNGIQNAIVHIKKKDLNEGELCFIRHDSAIDCTKVKMMTYNQLEREVVGGFKIYKTEIPQTMYSEIIEKVKGCKKTIRPRIKKILNDKL